MRRLHAAAARGGCTQQHACAPQQPARRGDPVILPCGLAYPNSILIHVRAYAHVLLYR
ncbi:hypothetical protein COLSTE_01875 [Collinsella stercoris DSM 13279]|uniref:Uncharacterized protein n=1 Tax=Collinsella stercoris DSM 13279 TaxID=445975 RepID=B6GCQ1_9ACTN|nr:hypothetical protein COLSTE_01875 [Collinsella stercoris DSM 13279]